MFMLARWAPALVVAAALDLSGVPVDPLPGPGAGPAVLVFVRTDCPIANRYAPELRRLQDAFSAKGVAFWLVYPDRSEKPDAIRRHQREFGLGFRALRDPQHELVKATGATVTPEAAVFVAGPQGPRMLYRGRIDDRYVDFGRSRPAPTTRDLRDVLQALGAGSVVTPRTTPAVGCFIGQ
jgi:AhpC/TSA family protein